MAQYNIPRHAQLCHVIKPDWLDMWSCCHFPLACSAFTLEYSPAALPERAGMDNAATTRRALLDAHFRTLGLDRFH